MEVNLSLDPFLPLTIVDREEPELSYLPPHSHLVPGILLWPWNPDKGIEWVSYFEKMGLSPGGFNAQGQEMVQCATWLKNNRETSFFL